VFLCVGVCVLCEAYVVFGYVWVLVCMDVRVSVCVWCMFVVCVFVMCFWVCVDESVGVCVCEMCL